MNTHLPVSNTTSPHEMEKWEVPVSEIRDQRYILVSTIMYSMATDNHIADRRRVPRECSGSEGKDFGNLAEREGCGLRGRIIRKCTKTQLQIGEVIQPSPTEWQPGGTVIQSYTPHVHPFDSHKRLLAILNDRPYISLEPPDDAPTFNARE